MKEMSARDPQNKKTVVIVGGGAAGAVCAESLRQEGFTGRIVMVCKEDVIPYDRIKVSKIFDFDIQKATLRPSSFYNDNKIETKLGVEAIGKKKKTITKNTYLIYTNYLCNYVYRHIVIIVSCIIAGLDTCEQLVKLSNNEDLKYDYLFTCTGGKPRMTNQPGSNLKNIFVVRNYTDSHAIHAVLSPDKHVIVLGAGFIGMEASAYCIGKCASITVIGNGTAPLETIFGAVIGNRIKKEHEEKGIVTKFISHNIKQTD